MIYAREIIPHIHFFMFKINNNLKNNFFILYKYIYIYIYNRFTNKNLKKFKKIKFFLKELKKKEKPACHPAPETGWIT